MSNADIRPGDRDGELLLSGVLDFHTGAALRSAGQQLINGASSNDLVINCQAVEQSTSVGLALLLAYTRDAAKAGKRLHFCKLPKEMLQIAKVSELTDILPIQD